MGDNIDFEAIIRKQLEKELDKDFIEYKEQKLNELNVALECKRNKIIQNILDSITITVEREFGSMTPNINIRITNQIIKEGENI